MFNIFNLVKRFSNNHKDMGIFYMFNFPFSLSMNSCLNVDHWLSFYVMLGVFTVLGTYLVWYYMTNSKVIAITTIYYNFIRFIRVYKVKSLRQLRSQSIYNFIFVFYLLLSFFFIIVLQDLDKSLLDIWHLHLIFYGVDQESKVSLLFFKTFFYSLVSLCLLLPFILSFVLFLYTASFTVLQKRMTVIFMFCYSLFFYILGIPTLRQLIMKSSNFIFFQNGVFSNTLFECRFFKLGITFYGENVSEVISNFIGHFLHYIVNQPNYNLRYVFDCATNNPAFGDPVLVKIFNCLYKDDMAGANQAFQELLNWQGPWNIQDIIDLALKNKLENSLMFVHRDNYINEGANLNKVLKMIFDHEGMVAPGRFLEDGPFLANYLQRCYQSTETQTLLAVSQDSYLMILGGVLLLLFLLLPPGSGKGDIAPGGLALARKFKQKGKTDFLDW